MSGRDEYQYSHDLHGALARGYARRARKAATDLIRNSAGWMNPMQPNVQSRGAFALQLLITELLKSGADPVKLKERIQRELDNFERTQEEAKREAAREPSRFSEDPFRFRDQDYTWDEYDAYVDSMPEKSVRAALKDEARIRKQLQDEREGLL